MDMCESILVVDVDLDRSSGELLVQVGDEKRLKN